MVALKYISILAFFILAMSQWSSLREKEQLILHQEIKIALLNKALKQKIEEILLLQKKKATAPIKHVELEQLNSTSKRLVISLKSELEECLTYLENVDSNDMFVSNIYNYRMLLEEVYEFLDYK